MLNNPCYMTKIFDENISVLEYLISSKMAFDKVWATEKEIFAAAHMLKTDIFIFGHYADKRPWVWHKHSARMFLQELQTYDRNIYLKNTNRNHYDVVLSISIPTGQQAHQSLNIQLDG